MSASGRHKSSERNPELWAHMIADLHFVHLKLDLRICWRVTICYLTFPELGIRFQPWKSDRFSASLAILRCTPPVNSQKTLESPAFVDDFRYFPGESLWKPLEDPMIFPRPRNGVACGCPDTGSTGAEKEPVEIRCINYIYNIYIIDMYTHIYIYIHTYMYIYI